MYSTDSNIGATTNIEKHSKLNKQIEIKIPRTKGLSGLFQSGNQPIFRVPPLNAVIESKYGSAPSKKSFTGFQSSSGIDNIDNVRFLNWCSVRDNTIGDPNKHRSNKLLNYTILQSINQDCCGACWAVSSAMAFSDRYAITNDKVPIMPSIISIMSCCTKNKHKNLFKLVDTPDCDVMSTYDELESSPNSMGMCSGGIPYSAGLTIYRNGLPSDDKTQYDASLFNCGSVPSFPNMNKAIIDKYSCDQNLYDDTTIRMMMDPDEKPTYISAHTGHPSSYVDMMKKALLDGGPLVGGYLVLGDHLAIGTDSLGLGMSGDKAFNWDTTGKVYVPGAYNNEWNSVILSSVGGSTTLDINDTNLDEPSKVSDKGLKPKDSIGNIFCGFHAVVIVGWGELDMKYVSNKNVKTIKGKDGRDKLPYWICRNSWGGTWPLNDYYNGGIKVMNDNKEENFKVPTGFWLHAMYPNESMGLDVPIEYEGTYYGATMVMKPQKHTISLRPPSSSNEINIWSDSEGYTCEQYKKFNWCTADGKIGEGWNSDWGNIKDFSNNGGNALDMCLECSGDRNILFNNNNNGLENDNSTIIFLIVLVIMCLLVGYLVYNITDN